MSSNCAADACACCVRSSQQVSKRCLFKGMCRICPEMSSDAHWMLFIFLHRAADAEWKERGAKMLKMMGWSEGEGLGRHSAGITAPLQTHVQTGKGGLGLAAEVAGKVADKISVKVAPVRASSESSHDA
jgi:hypothetical protein